jgi:membrane-associated phospholipid phosphatase
MALAVLAVAVALSLFAVPTAASASTPAREQQVESWIALELELIAANRLNPPRAARALAHVSTAMHLASLAPKPEPAVAGAASTVLEHFFPGDTRVRDAARRAREADSGPAGTLSFALGVLAGKALVARALNDGSDAVWTGAAPGGDGFWVATPPGFLLPLEPLAGTWRTWNISSGSQLRPAPPPPFGSAAFRAELDEVYAVWQGLTPEQKRIADFWADGPGTATPPGHWNAIALDLLRDRDLSTRAVARLFAVLNTAQAEAFIACWDAKFHYWTLRPVSAVRALLGDPTWLSYIVTPPFPAYVSGHSSTSGAAATVLSSFLPDRAAELEAMAEEAAISRLYGGIHFRSDNEAGLLLGQRIGARALVAYGLG